MKHNLPPSLGHAIQIIYGASGFVFQIALIAYVEERASHIHGYALLWYVNFDVKFCQIIYTSSIAEISHPRGLYFLIYHLCISMSII
jgi:hypothetical protein